MDSADNQVLINKAREITAPRQLTKECLAGETGVALLTDKGSIYTGISIAATCGIGFCAEHSAISRMLLYGETRIKKIVAVFYNGNILPPCGRCRELMYQIDRNNLKAEVILGPGKVVLLEELLPEHWQDFVGS